jgi:hypothetical protein
MARFVRFDHTQQDPKPVTGWFDTGEFTYAVMPETSDQLAVTDAQWAARTPIGWGISEGALVVYAAPVAPVPLAVQARDLLPGTDTTMHRVEEAVALGLNTWTNLDVIAWVTYRRELRAIVAGNSEDTVLPTPPPYPVGTA